MTPDPEILNRYREMFRPIPSKYERYAHVDEGRTIDPSTVRASPPPAEWKPPVSQFDREIKLSTATIGRPRQSKPKDLPHCSSNNGHHHFVKNGLDGYQRAREKCAVCGRSRTNFGNIDP